ncbi:MAG: type II toxin-antitoxin system VapC family toxin [Methylococcales bacterium]
MTSSTHYQQSIEEIEDECLFVSVISIGEITKGINLLEESHRKRGLNSWLQAIESNYSDRILLIDIETVRIWGELTAKAQKSGKTIAAADGLIAATAICHGLHVMTRNVDDFEPSGVLITNPWYNLK